MANGDFGPWLKNNRSGDDALTQLKEFAEAHRAEWPYHSNRISDYIRTVLNAHDPKEDALLTSLERYFLAWRNAGNGWGLWISASALIVAGLVVAIVVGFALFYTDLIDKLSSPGYARGLITFLFSFITIAVILIVVIALLWMDKEEDLDSRFTKAKDIIAILVGILGTIVGFYFGSNPTVSSTGAPAAILSPAASRPGAGPSGGGSGAPAEISRPSATGASGASLSITAPSPVTPEVAPTTPR